MRAVLCVLLAAAWVHADESEDRRSKLPYIADAVGNALPPPSNGPATVGSPVNLLTPDRYEFYTFDESGELVKRLMTLEEIQAIVAAGEETEGLVTFANENQPTIAFNFSQPPYTKVHSVVTNVQNVLKAQMEAHKNKPQTQPTLDTPDVSDSWSLILPSIFGNTGVDIVPDKSSSTFTTPDTETIELDNSLSKEGSNQIISSSSTKVVEDLKEITVTEKMPAFSSTTEKNVLPTSTMSTTSTTKLTYATSTGFTNPTTLNKLTTTTGKPTTLKHAVPTSTSSTTSPQTASPTARPHTTTTVKSTTKIIRTTFKPSTAKPNLTTRKTLATQNNNEDNFTRIQTFTNAVPTTAKPTVQYEKFSTFIPLSTAAYITERATTKPAQSTRLPVQTTRVSVETTRAPIETTKTQSIPTKDPILITRDPIQTTRVPVETTRVPTHTTRDPTHTTRAPTHTTRATIHTTRAPIHTTKAPSHTTRAPTYITRAPIPTTKASIFTTRRPAQTTRASIQTTKAQFVSSTTKRPVSSTTKSPSTTTIRSVPSATTHKLSISTSTYFSSASKEETEKFNGTTITTQSVSPSTAVSSTEYVSIENYRPLEKKPTESNYNSNTVKEKESNINIFDISQSISQIASDLGGNYRPIPTSSDLVDTTRFSEINLESKENLEMDIPNGTEKEKDTTISHYNDKNTDNFVKISTIEPHSQIEHKVAVESGNKVTPQNSTLESLDVKSTPAISVTTTIDPILSESMGDLLSQVVNEAPQKITDSEVRTTDKNIINSSEAPNIAEKVDKISELETTSLASVLTKKNESIEMQSPKIDINMTNNFVKHDSVDTQIHGEKSAEQDKTSGNVKLPNKQPVSKIENKDEVTNKPEVTTHKKDKIESVSQLPPAIRPLDITTEKKVEINSIDKKVSTTFVNDSQEQVKPIQDINKSETTLASTEVPQKLEAPKKQQQIIKKPESLTSSSNKIIPSENNKIANSKETQKVAEEASSPKVEEFKKKIQKVNIDDKELVGDRNSSWKLISTVAPPKNNEITNDKLKIESLENTSDKNIVLDVSKENQGLEVTSKDLNEDIAQFTELCNELAFRYWHAISETIEKKRSFVLSPYSITSMLAMMFMGARGATSGEMNEILKLDDMVTFNPHFTLKNISDSIETTPASGVIVSAFVRELFTDRSKGKVLTFYKERAQHFYNGHVEEINFKLISDIIRRRTNLLVKRYTWGKIVEYMKANTITMHPPLAAFSANIFETDCSGSSVEGRDGEMYFVVSPNVRQRRLVPVPAVVYRSGFLAGYDPVLDATAAALGNTNSVISTLFLMPGQQGNIVHAEDLEQLEKRLLDSNPTTPAWNRLLRTLLPRIGLELQIPRFSHKSLFNVSTTLKKMGLKELFDPEHADLGGLNGPSKDLYLSDMVQSTTVVTCGEGVIGDQHHIEEYPESLIGPQRRRTSRWAAGWDEPRDYQRAFHDPHDVGDAMHLPLHLRPRQARLPARNAQPARLKFDRPFLYFVRHNPSGMILYVGRYNPRLLP